MSQFIHLHVHSHMSMLDALPSPEDLALRAQSFEMSALALTDHGNLYGVPRFVRACREQSIKPIIGCEFYLVPDMDAKSRETETGHISHLTVLVKNRRGWENLIALSSDSFLRGYYRKGRIDEKTLFLNHEGLIVLSGCQSSEFSQALINQGTDEAALIAIRFREQFGDDYYLELMAHDRTPERASVNLGIEVLSHELGIPAVVTNDVHYLESDEGAVHSYLTKVQWAGKQGYRSDELWFKSRDDIWNSFATHWAGTGLNKGFVLDAMNLTETIAEGIEAFEITSGQDIAAIPFKSMEPIRVVGPALDDEPHFDGETYVHERDYERLKGQLRRVYDHLSDGRWHTLAGIRMATNDPEASISARIRDLRKEKFGGYTVDDENLGGGLWRWRLKTKGRT